MEESEAISKPPCKLVGRDGNVFVIIAAVCACLKKHDMPERAAAFREHAKHCASYDEVLRLTFNYVEPH